ncbi:AAA family ATPase [Bifidobacterium subtile]|jgi:MoxR-like ATPase|uniref:AAA family ATPase n=1 Tax=Bifidobacterium subtile TaxID=77635 RepID=UPI002F35DB6A
MTEQAEGAALAGLHGLSESADRGHIGLGVGYDARDTDDNSQIMADLIDTLDAVLSCSREVVELAVATFVAGGHLLLEDVPGVGKTTLARALGRAIGGSSRRIQFTPDLLPGDLTGVDVFSQASGSFVFHPGPLFANVVIADEINRANPKAQSAMLEAMGEGHASVDGETYELPDPYFVVATQNPIELEGTYPLPEAQLDRFMVCTSFGYPQAAAESAMLRDADGSDPLEGMRQVCSERQIAAVRGACGKVFLSAPVADYIVDLAHATREHPDVRYGVSPRGSLALAAMARAHALGQGRNFVIPEDVQRMAAPAWAHRLVMAERSFGASPLEQSRTTIAGIVGRVPPPRPQAHDGRIGRLAARRDVLSAER